MTLTTQETLTFGRFHLIVDDDIVDAEDGLALSLSLHAATRALRGLILIVWGMPGAAFKYGASEQLVPLDKMAETILKLV